MSSAPSSGPSQRLLVSGRAAARYLNLHPASVTVAADAGLLTRHGDGETISFDAAEVLRLGERPFVDQAALRRHFAPRSVLLVQQTSATAIDHDEDPHHDWRRAFGWSTTMRKVYGEDADLHSARGWWPVGSDRASGLVGLVSTLASFVVTIAVVRGQDLAEPSQWKNRIRLDVDRATRSTPEGLWLLEHFEGRRILMDRGSSHLIPRPVSPVDNEAGDLLK